MEVSSSSPDLPVGKPDEPVKPKKEESPGLTTVKVSEDLNKVWENTGNKQNIAMKQIWSLSNCYLIHLSILLSLQNKKSIN